MSPHAVTQEESIEELLASFNVTRNGFLPAEEPLKSIPSSYYEPWELLIHNLQSLLANGTLRQRVDSIPVLSTDKLRTEAEWRRAYVILTLLTHSYVWGGDKAAEILPPSISVPLLTVSSHLEVPPVATYAALNLWNFASTTADFTDLDSVYSPHTFTGTKDESWFLCVSVAMEAQGAHIIPLMLKAIYAIPTKDYDTIANALDQLSGSIKKVGALLHRMREECDPMVFYHRIRPFLAGSKNMAAAGLPKGLYYDEGNGKGSWQQWRGGSNGQSSLIQFWDAVLGVTHAAEGTANPHAKGGKPEQKSFHEEVREYMPGGHRRLLEYVWQSDSIRTLAMLPTSGPKHARMQEAYASAIKTLTEFRTGHVGIVTAYIILPSRKAMAEAEGKHKTVNLATTSTMQQNEKKGSGKESADNQLTGTGGTALLPFLKQSRDETFEAGVTVREHLAVRQ
ncbi:unnamed protein product [Discula destructiva]